METKLKRLFDYQRFRENERLQRLIEDTEQRYGEALDDDQLSMVSAAGERQPGKPAGPDGCNV